MWQGGGGQVSEQLGSVTTPNRVILAGDLQKGPLTQSLFPHLPLKVRNPPQNEQNLRATIRPLFAPAERKAPLE